jgi:hypothetical protein
MDMGVICWRQNGRGLKLTTHLQVLLSFCMRGAIPLRPLYVFMACTETNFTSNDSTSERHIYIYIYTVLQCCVLNVCVKPGSHDCSTRSNHFLELVLLGYRASHRSFGTSCRFHHLAFRRKVQMVLVNM